MSPRNEHERRGKRSLGAIPLRLLLVGFLFVSVLLGIVGNLRTKANRQSQAVAELRNNGAIVLYDYEVNQDGELTGSDSPVPTWVKGLAGEGAFQSVYSVSFLSEYTPDDRVVREIQFLNGIREIDLQYSLVTDRGIELLSGHQDLHSLNLGNTGITDNAIESLAHMERLEWLNVRNTRISDKAMHTLGSLNSLVTVNLSGTDVTQEGLRHLSRCERLEFLFVRGIDVDDGFVKWFTEHAPLVRIVHR